MPTDPAVPLSVTVKASDEGTVVAVSGELDMFTGPQLRGSLLPAVVDALPGTDVRVDLSALSFCDSSGLAVLIEARHQALAGGTRLVLVSPRGAVLRVLRVSGVARLFDVDDAETE